MDDSRTIVVCNKVGKAYAPGDANVIHDVSFSVTEGEFMCIIGASGCGKSTLIKIIAGLEEPSTGAITRPAKSAMVFQTGALLPWFTAIQNVAIGLRAKGMSEAHANTIATKYLEMMGLTGFENKYPRELSGGQRQRVGIARALAIEPAVLLLDEPFSALDAKTTHFLHEDLIKIWRETHITIIMISHLIEEAVSLGQKVMLMENGTITETFPIPISYPRHEQGIAVLQEVQKIRNTFFR